MSVADLQQQLQQLTESLFAEEFLDDQFSQLQQLQDESSPEFVGEVVGLFFEDSEKLLETLTDLVNAVPPDFKKIDASVHQFKGSSSSIGAARVKNICVDFRVQCEEHDIAGCKDSLAKVKEEFYLVKNKLSQMMELEHEILEKGGTLPFMEGRASNVVEGGENVLRVVRLWKPGSRSMEGRLVGDFAHAIVPLLLG